MNEDDVLNDKREYLFKILVVGEPNVGKTSLVRKYCTGNFTDKYKSTIGVDFLQKDVEYDQWTNTHIHFWDLAGQERIGTQANILFRDTHGVICLFDVTNENTKAQVAAWKQLINEKTTMAGEHYIPPCILVANKIDKVCEQSDQFDTTEIEAMAEQLGFEIAFPTSIKGNYNVENAITNLIRLMIHANLSLSHKTYEEDIIELEEFAGSELRKRSYCSSYC